MKLSEELSWRGFSNQTTYKDNKALDGDPITFYWGVDPSSDSMTIGNLAAAMMVKAFIRHGNKAYLLVGGATGLIGDPDGKSEERDLKSPQRINHNVRMITKQYERIFNGSNFKVVNNSQWYRNVRYINFLREVGKYVPMREMLGREFVESRLNDRSKGISYAEFSYSLIQAYDYYHLCNEHNVTLQLCGADQWGNSIAGVNLIRRKLKKEAHIYSAPLIVNKATGKKFGKSEEGAVWLDSKKTSTYKFYQYWLNVDDHSVEDYLKIFTELDRRAVDDVMHEFDRNPGARAAQKKLAFEVTKLVHGLKAATIQERIASVLFGGEDVHSLHSRHFEVLEEELPVAKLPKNPSMDALINALVKTGLASSKGEARKFMSSGAIYVNDQKIHEPSGRLVPEAYIDSGVMVVRRGKNTNAILKLV